MTSHFRGCASASAAANLRSACGTFSLAGKSCHRDFLKKKTNKGADTIRPRGPYWTRVGLGLAAGVMATGLTVRAGHAEKMTCAETALPLASLEVRLKKLPTRAAICVREGKPLQAVVLMTRLIRHKPVDPVAYLNRGNAYAAAGEVAQAVSDFTTAISLKPLLVEAWYNRGTTFTHLRRYEYAINDFTEAIRLKPSFAFAYCNRGFAYFRLGEYDHALADYTAGIDRSTGPSFCYLNRGTLYLALGEYEKAIADFSMVIGDKPITQVIGDRPAGAIALGRRGQAYEALGEACQALDDYRAALEAYPKLEAAREGFARVSMQQKQAEEHE